MLDLPVLDLPALDLPVLDLPALDLPALDLPVRAPRSDLLAREALVEAPPMALQVGLPVEGPPQEEQDRSANRQAEASLPRAAATLARESAEVPRRRRLLADQHVHHEV